MIVVHIGAKYSFFTCDLEEIGDEIRRPIFACTRPTLFT